MQNNTGFIELKAQWYLEKEYERQDIGFTVYQKAVECFALL